MQAKLRLKWLILALAAPCVAQAAPLYTIVVPPGANGLSPQAMNNAGQIVGYSPTQTAAVTGAGGTTSLHPPGADRSYGFGINDAGVVSGQVDRGAVTRATMFSGGTATDLGALGGASTSSYGAGINNSGQVTGASYLSGDSGDYHAILYSAGIMHDLGTLGGTASYGHGINDSGVVVGDATLTANTAYHAFRYAGGIMSDLGTLGGRYSSAFGINSLGVVVGNSQVDASGLSHAFMSNGGAMIDLGSLGADSYAYDINDAGQVVGSSIVGGMSDAFLWTGGLMQDLNALIDSSSGWHLNYAAGINESGQIAVDGCRAGVCQALLLNLVVPDVTDPNGVPEPASFAAVAAALGLAGMMRRRKQRVRR